MDITFLLVQSERCFRMARECADPQIAAQLEEMSREFEEKADEYGTRMARELLHPSPSGTSPTQYRPREHLPRSPGA